MRRPRDDCAESSLSRQYGQPSAGPQFPDGALWNIERPKSSVHVAGLDDQPLMARGLTPVPASRKLGVRMFRQWSALRIHALTVASGVRRPVAMFSPAVL